MNMKLMRSIVLPVNIIDIIIEIRIQLPLLFRQGNLHSDSQQIRHPLMDINGPTEMKFGIILCDDRFIKGRPIKLVGDCI